jgi:hypothetical protein
MVIEGEGEGRMLHFRTNVDDLATGGPENTLRFETGAKDGVIPYVHVRRDLWARLTRPLALDLLALVETRDGEDGALMGVAAGGAFHPICRADGAGMSS